MGRGTCAISVSKPLFAAVKSFGIFKITGYSTENLFNFLAWGIDYLL